MSAMRIGSWLSDVSDLGHYVSKLLQKSKYSEEDVSRSHNSASCKMNEDLSPSCGKKEKVQVKEEENISSGWSACRHIITICSHLFCLSSVKTA